MPDQEVLVAFDWANADLQEYMLDWALAQVRAYGLDGYRLVVPRIEMPSFRAICSCVSICHSVRISASR